MPSGILGLILIIALVTVTCSALYLWLSSVIDNLHKRSYKKLLLSLIVPPYGICTALIDMYKEEKSWIYASSRE